MSVAIEQVPAPFLVTVTLRAEPASPDLNPAPSVRPLPVAVPSGWVGFSAAEVAELTWEDVAWQ